MKRARARTVPTTTLADVPIAGSAPFWLGFAFTGSVTSGCWTLDTVVVAWLGTAGGASDVGIGATVAALDFAGPEPRWYLAGVLNSALRGATPIEGGS